MNVYLIWSGPKIWGLQSLDIYSNFWFMKGQQSKNAGDSWGTVRSDIHSKKRCTDDDDFLGLVKGL